MTAGNNDNENNKLPTREDMLKKLAIIVDLTTKKIESGRIRDATNEKVRVQWGRLAAQAIDAYLRGLKDDGVTDEETARDVIVFTRKLDEASVRNPDL